MTRYVVRFAPGAEADLADLFSYIERQSGAMRAEKLIAEIVDACRRLDLFPERGTLREDVRSGLRIFGVRRFVTIAFTVEEREVVIHRVLGRGRNVTAILKGPSGE